MRTFAIAVGVGLLAISSIAEAQWVMLARRAVGRVEQMSQQSPQSGGARLERLTRRAWVCRLRRKRCPARDGRLLGKLDHVNPDWI